MVIAASLPALRGPFGGIVVLPAHLDWSGSASYDLDDDARLIDYYRTVLIEATKPDDLHEYLDRGTLVRLWPMLWLPADLRGTWERRFPELRPTGTSSAAA
ncbi:hypothetical protein [Winogradskya consettensis]|uniref:hypothetical protein n=1 Tax=Winogradskya consettensis TaxID=113560 RepID=UPI001FD3FD27|nr:hypothetical protein [Actinoplanes consettensis]